MQYPYQFYWTAACRIWTVACHILQYLKGAPSKGLYYRPSSYLAIVKYSDTDQAGDPIDHRSITGYCIFVVGNLVT